MALHIGFGIKGATQDAVDYRLGQAGLVARSTAGVARAGVFPAGSGALVSARADLTVDIAAFVAVLTRGSSYGTVVVSNDGAMQSPTFGVAPGSNSRIDVLWLRQNDSVDAADANDLPTWGITAGTAAPSPVAPSVPSGALAFAQVLIPAGATATNSGGVVITDVFPYTAAAGGVVHLRSQAEQDAWSPIDGSRAYRLDTSMGLERVGGAWISATASDTGWTLCTSQNAGVYTVSAYGDDRALSVRRIGKDVVLEGHIVSNVGTSPDAVWAFIPAGFRPGKNHRVEIQLEGNGTTTVRGFVTPTGALTVSTGIASGTRLLVAGNWFIE